MASLTDRVTAQYRRQQLQLRAATLRDMVKLWPALDWARLVETYPVWFQAASTLIARDATTANVLAGQYLRAFRQAAGVPKEVLVLTATLPAAEQVATSLEVTAPVAFKKGMAAGYTVEKASASALVQASGAATRLVLNSGRDTVRLTTISDPESDGWRRVGSGSCAFCRMLIARGAVYSEATVGFASHDHCACSAEPVYGGTQLPARDYVPSTKNITDADRARVRAYLKANDAG